MGSIDKFELNRVEVPSDCCEACCWSKCKVTRFISKLISCFEREAPPPVKEGRGDVNDDISLHEENLIKLPVAGGAVIPVVIRGVIAVTELISVGFTVETVEVKRLPVFIACETWSDSWLVTGADDLLSCDGFFCAMSDCKVAISVSCSFLDSLNCSSSDLPSCCQVNSFFLN